MPNSTSPAANDTSVPVAQIACCPAPPIPQTIHVVPPSNERSSCTEPVQAPFGPLFPQIATLNAPIGEKTALTCVAALNAPVTTAFARSPAGGVCETFGLGMAI